MEKTAEKLVVCLGADHAGFSLKETIKTHLTRLGYVVRDFGAFGEEPSDYPDFVIPATEAAVKESGRAIVFGGSGIGECVAANKVEGARAALAYDDYTARVTREHNDSNVLCLGSRTVTGNPELAKKLVNLWLTTPFSGDARHVRRLKKIADRESRNSLDRKDASGLFGP